MQTHEEKLECIRRIRLRRRRFIDAVARTAGCTDCRTNEGRLEFDHRDPFEKNFELGRVCTRSLKAIIAEMELCDVRCARCHRRRHRWGTQFDQSVRSSSRSYAPSRPATHDKGRKGAFALELLSAPSAPAANEGKAG